MVKRIKYFIWVFIILFSIACNRSKENAALKHIQKGEKLFHSSGCIMCHSLSGEKLYGPALDSILNTEINVIRELDTLNVRINKDYLKRSIQNPDYEKPLEYNSTKMPIPVLAEEQINAIVDYLIYVNEKKEK